MISKCLSRECPLSFFGQRAFQQRVSLVRYCHRCRIHFSRHNRPAFDSIFFRPYFPCESTAFSR